MADQQRAADAFKAAVLAVPEGAWNVPRAPGKWSPAQVVDHVGVSTRVARNAVAGNAGMGGIPKFLRWLPRKTFFEKVLAKGFPVQGRGPAVFAPARDPMPRQKLIEQLDHELSVFVADARAAAAAGTTTFEHTFFGRIAIADYITFNARHLDHHREQLPGA
ncbi:MAG: DinB family protein [Gemmatimonadota bacterium]|nr:DinB family protein [Gemmatimonadota bacterium]